jgi:SAM-dependent methyltransferase
MMSPLPNRPEELEKIYERRFSSHLAYRDKVWQILTRQYFSRFVNAESAVLDVGCGYGEFINHIAARTRYAMDLNPRARRFLHPDVTFLEQDCSKAWDLAPGSLDVVFSSNFFEHLPSKHALAATLEQAWRCLREGGRMIAMGPNIRFVGGAYWDFWDHHLALTDLSMAEALATQGFQIERVIDRFLPYTMVNKRRAPTVLMSLYLKLPPAWKFFGKQFLVTAIKESGRASV